MPLTLQQRLTEAEEAYHRLQIGESAAEVRDSNGESVHITGPAIWQKKIHDSLAVEIN